MWTLVNVFDRRRTSTMMRKQTAPLQQSWNREGPIRSTSNPVLPPSAHLQHTDLHRVEIGHLSTPWRQCHPCWEMGGFILGPDPQQANRQRWSIMTTYFTFDSILTRKKSSDIVARSVEIWRPKRNGWNFK